MKTRNEKSYTFLNMLSSYLPYRESIPLFLLGSMGLVAGWFVSRENLRNYSHVWLAPTATLFGTLILGYFGRCKEARELANTIELRKEELDQKDMKLQFELGEQALKQQEYLAAYDYFNASLQIFRQIFDKDTRTKVIHLKNLAIYKQGLALFGLKRYEEAKALISEIIVRDDARVLSLSPLQISLLNLRAAILFIQGCLNANSFLWKDAKIDFERSYLADPSQNTVYLYLQYLNGKYGYIAENIPNEQWNPKINLHFKEADVLFNGVMLLCADSCVRQKKWVEAICLYENYLTVLENSSNAFLELFLLNINCFRAYVSLLESCPNQSELKLFRIVQHENEHQLVSENFTREVVIATAVNRFESAKACLEGELFMGKDKIAIANKHLQQVSAYASLVVQSQRLPSLKELSGDLKKMAIEHLSKAKNLLDTKNLLLKKAEEIVADLEPNDENNEEDVNRCTLF